MRLACQSDFYGEIYTHYRHHEGYAKRAALLKGFRDPVLVVGCGFGFLVDELVKIGKDAWGIDVSFYAIENRTNDRVIWGNILEPLGLTEFGLVVTEDLLPYLTDEEAKLASINCRKLAPIVIHLVTEQGEADLNYHTTGYWMNLTKQLTVSLEGM